MKSTPLWARMPRGCSPARPACNPTVSGCTRRARPTQRATRLTGPHEPPFDLQRKRSGGGGRTRGTKRARPRRAVRRRRRWHRRPQGTSLTLPAQEPTEGRCPRRSAGRRARTRAQTTRSGRHNDKLANDVRVSPTEEGLGVVDEDELPRAARRLRSRADGSPPQSRGTTRSRRRDSRNCRAPRGCSADLLRGAPWVRFVTAEVYQEGSPREPGGKHSACVPKF